MTLRFLGRQARHEDGHDEEGKQKPRREGRGQIADNSTINS